MKILQIINSLGTGGAEKLLLDTLPLYREKGIEMDVLVFWDNNLPFINALKALNCCKVIVLKESDNYKDIYSISHIWKLRKYLKGYDIVHVHLFPAQYFTVFANNLIGNKCKLIFTEHNTSNTRMASAIFSKIDRFIYRGFIKIVAITNDVNSVLQKYLDCYNGKIITIGNGVNLEEVKKAIPLMRNELIPSLKDNEKLLVQVGGFRIQKDQETVIKALSFLPNNFHLLLVGDGERKSILEGLASQFGLQDRIHFLGIREDVFAILKTVDCVIVSSHWEGFGLVAVEGMGASKPVLASNVPGLSEIVGRAGILFEVGNAQQLAAKIQELLNNKPLYDDTVKLCQQRAAQYDINIMIDKHIQLYKEVYEA